MRQLLAVLMLLHGVGHLPGFVGAWRLAELPDLPYGTTVLAGRLDVGDGGMRGLGLAWLAAALGFWAAAWGALAGSPWWTSAALAASLVSLALTVLAVPASRLGIPVNLAILAALVLGSQSGW